MCLRTSACVDFTSFVRSWSSPRTCGQRMRLRELVLGPPLSASVALSGRASVEQHRQELRDCVLDLAEMLMETHGRVQGISATTNATNAAQAASELKALCELMPPSASGDERGAGDTGDGGAAEIRAAACATCMKAAVLYALSREPEVQRHFTALEEARRAQGDGDGDGDGAYVRDFVERVLPLCVPRLLSGLCQRPDVFVTQCVAFSEMWRGERLGNWGVSDPAQS